MLYGQKCVLLARLFTWLQSGYQVQNFIPLPPISSLFLFFPHTPILSNTYLLTPIPTQYILSINPVFLLFYIKQ